MVNSRAELSDISLIVRDCSKNRKQKLSDYKIEYFFDVERLYIYTFHVDR